jgi:adenylate cyclase
MQRQLAAILFADVSGYGRLMDTYESDTHLRLMALRAEIIEPLIAANAGRIVKHTGDGFIACFASVNSALDAALGMQREVARREAAEPAERRIAFRLGLHSGDVTLEAGDAYGAGVNLAARLQDIAEPGSIFISGTVHEQLGGNLKEPTVDLGYMSLKNIANPVRVFRIGGAPASDAERPVGRVSPALRQSRPSIAVLPFAELGADTQQGYFGDGIVEDVVGALASLPDLFVISRSSTLKYRASPPDLRAISNALDVRYVLWGSVRRRGDRLRISVELADTETQRAIDTYQSEGTTAELFALQDRLVERVAQTIAPNIRQAELRRIRRKRPENLDAYDYWLRGLDLLYRLDRDEFEEARRMFQQSIRLDPNYAAPYAFSALWHSACIIQGWSHDETADRAGIEEFSAAALRRDPHDVWALALSGQLRALWFRDFDSAFDLLERALRASPSSAFAYMRSSPVFSYIGDGAEGWRRAEQALRLSPLDPLIFFTHSVLAFAAYTEGDYEKAIIWGHRAYAANPKYTANLRNLAASLAADGRVDEARRIGSVLLSIDNGFRVRRFCQNYAYREEPRREQLATHLLLAGLPE